MKVAALLCLASATLMAQQMREGNFDIHFEPVVKLQTHAPITFRIRVLDARSKPLRDARVLLRISRPDGSQEQMFKAPADDPITDPGIYISKPVFPGPGQWEVNARVTRDQQQSTWTNEYTVPE